MELVLILCLGTFAGAIITWAWQVINPRMQWREATIENDEKELLQQFQKLDLQKRNIQSEIELQLDAERNRISSELHDDLIQRLAGIRLSLLHITLTHTIDAEANKKIKQLSSDLMETMEVTRMLIWGLSITSIENESLANVIRSLCQKLSKMSLLKISFLEVSPEWERPVAETVKRAVHRIVQESAYNAVKYSNGWVIEVKMQWHHDRVSVAIEDDGEGFKQEPHNGGYGMQNIFHRANEINARIDILPNKPRGTIVHLEIMNQELK